MDIADGDDQGGRIRECWLVICGPFDRAPPRPISLDQDHVGKPWSDWGEGCVANGKYYSAIGDHHSPKGTAHVYEYDPATKSIRSLVATRASDK